MNLKNLLTHVRESPDHVMYLLHTQPVKKAEMISLNELTEAETKKYLEFVGVHAFNETPMMILTEDEAKTAFLAFRHAAFQQETERDINILEVVLEWIESRVM